MSSVANPAFNHAYTVTCSHIYIYICTHVHIYANVSTHDACSFFEKLEIQETLVGFQPTVRTLRNPPHPPTPRPGGGAVRERTAKTHMYTLKHIFVTTPLFLKMSIFANRNYTCLNTHTLACMYASMQTLYIHIHVNTPHIHIYIYIYGQSRRLPLFLKKDGTFENFGGNRNLWKSVNNPAECSKSGKNLILKKDWTFANLGGSRNFQKKR